VEVRRCKTTPPVDGFAGASVLPLTPTGRYERGLKTRVVESVSAQLPGLETGRLEPESQELLLHLGPAQKYAAHILPACPSRSTSSSSRSYAVLEGRNNKGIESLMRGENLCLSHCGCT
jgi:hypothetical protein